MEIDKKTIKALASDTKVNILKTLTKRNKTNTELSKELQLATSTMTEHLKELEKLNLIKRTETGHKWVYYELTKNGKNIIKPVFPVQIVLTLSIGFLMVIGSFLGTFLTYNALQTDVMRAPMQEAGKEVAGVAEPAMGIDPIFIFVFIIGILLIIYGIWKLRKR